MATLNDEHQSQLSHLITVHIVLYIHTCIMCCMQNQVLHIYDKLAKFMQVISKLKVNLILLQKVIGVTILNVIFFSTY